MKAKYKTTYEYLESHNKSNGDFHTCYTTNGYHKWLPYKSEPYMKFYGSIKNFTPNHREVLANEVIIDCDNKAKFVREAVYKRIKETNLAYSMWDTGNRGTHIHLYFEKIDKLTYEDRKLIKELIIRYYFGDLIKSCKIDMALVSRHMIRIEYGKHEKTKLYKDFITADRELERNKILPEIKAQFEHKKELFSRPRKPQKGCSISEPPECVKHFLSDDFRGAKDGRLRALFVLGSWYKQNNIDSDDIIEELIRINHYALHDYWTMNQIISTVKSSKGTLRCYGRHKILEDIGREDVIKKCVLKQLEELK